MRGPGLAPALAAYRYAWPREVLADGGWTRRADGGWERTLPESRQALAADSRWPALFPSPMCVVTVADGTAAVLERVVGPSIVNRFPYVLALSFCVEPLSERHYARRAFARALESAGTAAVQFLPPGGALDRVLGVIEKTSDDEAHGRLTRTELGTRPALTCRAPVFADAYLVYEGRLARPGRDLDGVPIYPEPWRNVGSHRVYFLEIVAIQLRRDIAEGRSQIRWRSLPAWTPAATPPPPAAPGPDDGTAGYQKAYTPHYAFPSAGTIAFEADEVVNGMAVKRLPPEAADQIEVDNDRARWPCFFPSSVGMITTWATDGRPNLMPCGSTTVVSRQPLVITPCVSYAAINERYAPRLTLDLIRRNGRFGCGVPYIGERVVSAIKYAGNVSWQAAGDKVARSGLAIEPGGPAPVLADLPVHFDCEVVGEVRLGTHVMFLGEVRRIQARPDVTPANPLEWCPWADVRSADG
ncbi:MAG TPA: flavin reductase family protein [Methylomirabilota bacterium]|nr:flavin reductase family protein [Methylomirabilota bacterium]